MLLQNRRHCIRALLCAALVVVHLPLSHAVLKIKNIWGIYRKYGPNIGCPTAVTAWPPVKSYLHARIATSHGCGGGTVLLTERTGPTGTGDAVTQQLTGRGEGPVGPIVLGEVTKEILCPCFRVEEIMVDEFLNFIRPRTLTVLTLGNQTTRFPGGQRYIILREACIYVYTGLPPSPRPASSPSMMAGTLDRMAMTMPNCPSPVAIRSPAVCPPPMSTVAPAMPAVPANMPLVPSASRTPATSPARAVTPLWSESLPSTAPASTVNSVPTKSVNLWVWAGPVIGISVVALGAIVAFAAKRHARAQWYPFSFQGDSETSLRRYFGSVSSSPLPRPEVDETAPRMRCPEDESIVIAS